MNYLVNESRKVFKFIPNRVALQVACLNGAQDRPASFRFRQQWIRVRNNAGFTIDSHIPLAHLQKEVCVHTCSHTTKMNPQTSQYLIRTSLPRMANPKRDTLRAPPRTQHGPHTTWTAHRRTTWLLQRCSSTQSVIMSSKGLLDDIW